MTVFSVWAPAASRVEVEAAGRVHPLLPGDRPGWWRAEVDARSGTDYAFRLAAGAHTLKTVTIPPERAARPAAAASVRKAAPTALSTWNR